MFQNNGKINGQDFFYADSDLENQTIYFSMTKNKMIKIIEKLNKFSSKNDILLDEYNVLNIEVSESFTSIKKIIFSYIESEDDNLIINLIKNNTLHIFFSEIGIVGFIDSLLCLIKSLNKGQIEDISYMALEWALFGVN